MFSHRSARRQSFLAHQDRHPGQHRVTPDKVELRSEGLRHPRFHRLPRGERQEGSPRHVGIQRPLVDHAQVNCVKEQNIIQVNPTLSG